jgi:small subunit ribosomal protein S4
VLHVSWLFTNTGQMISVREKSKSLETISNSLARGLRRGNWLEWDGATLTGKFMSYPERDQITENCNEQAIVELYSK